LPLHTRPNVLYTQNVSVFTARRCASAVFAVVVSNNNNNNNNNKTTTYISPSVRPSVTRPVLCRNDWTDRAGFWREGLRSPITHCAVRKFGYLQKTGVLASGTLSRTLDLATFATASRSRCRQNPSSSSSTVELVDCTTAVERVVAGCTKFITRW